MAKRILPLLEIECGETHCEDCDFLQPGPRCGLLSGSLDVDPDGVAIRAEECVDAGARAAQ